MLVFTIKFGRYTCRWVYQKLAIKCVNLLYWSFLDLQQKLFVNIVSAEDGALSVLDATRTLCANVQSGDTKASHINSELVDNIIQGMHFR